MIYAGPERIIQRSYAYFRHHVRQALICIGRSDTKQGYIADNRANAETLYLLPMVGE